MKVTRLLARNLRIALRSKATILAILAAPLLAVLIASISFDATNQYALKLAVYGTYVPKIANQFLEDLSQNGFSVTKVRSSEECQSLVRNGLYHACILLDADSKNQILMTLLVDYSKIQVVDYLLSKVSDRVSLQSSMISLNVTEAILKRIESTKEEVDKNRYIITALTTGQEVVGRQLDELNAKLSGMDPKIQLDLPARMIESLQENRAVSQLESISRLKNDLINRVSTLSNEIEGVIKDSAMSESEKNAIRLIISKNDDKVRKIGDEFRVTERLTQKDLEDLKGQMKTVLDSLSRLQAKLDEAKEVRFDATVQIQKLKGTLKDNVIKIVVLQNALNKIGSSVDSLKISREGILQPIKTEIRPIASSNSRFVVLFPIILAFMMMISSTVVGASLVSFHRQNPGSVRDQLLPIHPASQLWALFLTVASLMMTQSFLGLGLAALLIGPGVVPGLASASAAILSIVWVFGWIGMALGMLFITEQGAVMGGIALTTVLFILSDALFPMEAMPTLVAMAAGSNPFVLGEIMIKKALIYHSPFMNLLPALVWMALIGSCCMILVYLLYHHRM